MDCMENACRSRSSWKNLDTWAYILSRALSLPRRTKIGRGEEVGGLVEVLFYELLAADPVFLAGIFEEAIIAAGDAGFDLFQVGEHVDQVAGHLKLGAVTEVDTVVRLHFDEGNQGVEVFAAGGEEFAVDIGHEQQGGAGVEPEAVYFKDIGASRRSWRSFPGW